MGNYNKGFGSPFGKSSDYNRDGKISSSETYMSYNLSKNSSSTSSIFKNNSDTKEPIKKLPYKQPITPNIILDDNSFESVGNLESFTVKVKDKLYMVTEIPQDRKSENKKDSKKKAKLESINESVLLILENIESCNFSSLSKNLFSVLESIHKSSVIIEFMERLIHFAKNGIDNYTMIFIKAKIMPIALPYFYFLNSSSKVAEFEHEMDNYINLIENVMSESQKAQRYDWRETAPSGSMYRINPSQYNTEKEYLYDLYIKQRNS